MKKRIILPLSVLLVVFCCCSKDSEAPCTGGGAAVTFDIALDGQKTQTTAETNINRLQVALYDNAGQLEWENTYEYSFTAIKTVSGLVEGPKTIVAVANKTMEMPSTLEEFYATPVFLEENRRDAFVMSGSESAVATENPVITTLRLRRAVAKITVRSSISTLWDDGKQHEFIPEGIYLSNVATRTNLRGDAFGEFANLREELLQSEDAVIRDFTVARKNYWTNGGVFNRGVDFYVCPNSSEKRKTALIIQAKYDGRDCYYPLVVSDTLRSNTMYRCGAIVISCEGMPRPDDDFSSIRVHFNYDSEDWAIGQTESQVVFE